MIGKWIFINDEDTGDKYSGCVTDLVGDDYCLVAMSPPKAPPYSRLFTIDELATSRETVFFDQQSDLDAWIAALKEDEDMELALAI